MAGTSSDGSLLTIGLFNRKTNLGALRPAIAFDVRFAGERTTFTRVDVAAIDELATALPIRERIRSVLRAGPNTIAAIAKEIDALPDTVEKTLKRNSRLFTKLTKTGDGIHRFALVERRA